MITRMRLKNFKSWRDTGDVEFGKITGIFGKNSSGKSSLIQALLLLKQTKDNVDPNTVLKFSGPTVDLGSFRETVFQHDLQACLHFSLYWDSRPGSAETDTVGLSVDVTEQKNITVLKRLAYHLAEDRTQVVFERGGSVSRVLTSWTGDAYDGLPYKFYGIAGLGASDAREKTAAGLSAFRLEQTIDSISHLGPLRSRPERLYQWGGDQPRDVGTNGENAVSALIAARSDSKSDGAEKQVATWMNEVGLVDQLDVTEITAGSQRYEVRVRESNGSPRVLITDVGVGVSQLLPVLTLLAYVSWGSTVILEHPELHLHPDAQSRLADILISAALDRHLQIIVESHSEHLLYRLQRRIAEQAFSAYDARLYFCQMQEGESKLEQLQIDTYGYITNWPHDFFGNPLHDMARAARAAADREAREHA